MYDNLLEENWRVELLNKIIVLGNSFQNYIRYASELRSYIIDSGRHLILAQKFTDEFRIGGMSNGCSAISDATCHFFSPVVESKLESRFFIV